MEHHHPCCCKQYVSAVENVGLLNLHSSSKLYICLFFKAGSQETRPNSLVRQTAPFSKTLTRLSRAPYFSSGDHTTTTKKRGYSTTARYHDNHVLLERDATLCQTAPVKSVKFQPLQRGVHSREMQCVEQSGVVIVFEKCYFRIWAGVYLEIAIFLVYFFRFFSSHL